MHSDIHTQVNTHTDMRAHVHPCTHVRALCALRSACMRESMQTRTHLYILTRTTRRHRGHSMFSLSPRLAGGRAVTHGEQASAGEDQPCCRQSPFRATQRQHLERGPADPGEHPRARDLERHRRLRPLVHQGWKQHHTLQGRQLQVGHGAGEGVQGRLQLHVARLL